MRTSILENNGKWSSTKQKNNISGPYFFINDRTKTAEIIVEYFNIKWIITDWFTKPLQGALFCKLCVEIQGITADDTNCITPPNHDIEKCDNDKAS